METLGSRLRFARSAAGLSQEAVAKQFGISRVSVTQWEADKTSPDRDKLPALAELLGTTMPWLMQGQGEAPPKAGSPAAAGKRNATAFNPEITPGQHLVGMRGLPVYAAAMGGNGHLIVSFDAIDTLKMPAVLENVKGGYGLLIRGESMVPAYWEGDIALVHPHLQPARGFNVVLYHTQPTSGEVEAIVKQLEGWNDRDWTLKQWNPLETFKETRADWPICHRIVGKYDRR